MEAKSDHGADEALHADDLPHLYANGFQCAVGNCDIVVVLQMNNRAVATVNLSLTLAKTLSEKLGNIVRIVEKAAAREIMTTEDIETALKGYVDDEG